MVIAEKPSVARDIARALGRPVQREGYIQVGEYTVTWALGHLFEIDDSIAPKKWSLEDLPIFPEEFRYKSVKLKQLSVVRKLLEKAEVVVNCGDAGREGELIVREILREIGYKGKVLRLWTSEALTPQVVRKEFTRLRPSQEFDSLYYSALARQHSDWLVGINLTRLVTLRAGGREVWSVGRVQTPTLRLVVERDEAVESFVPQKYFVVRGRFGWSGGIYEGLLMREGIAKLNEEEATEVASKLSKVREGKVISVELREQVSKPPLLHSLTSLQREANVVYGLSAKRTLDAAQALYETYKVISYPRTDARHLGESNVQLVKDVLTRLGKEELISKVSRVGKRVFDSTKLTDHHAIIPLDRPPANLKEVERKVYDLVYRKFVGAFMDDHIYHSITVITSLGGENFLSEGKRDVQMGWMSLYREPEDNTGNLPRTEVQVENLEVEAEEKETEPPPRYSESTLLKEMERLSLGTPSTRAAIIETLLDRGYMKRERRTLVSTPKGRELVAKLRDSKVSSPEMTGEWERELERIYLARLGKDGYNQFMAKIKEFVKEELDRLKQARFEVKREEIKCRCGGKVQFFGRGWKCDSCGSLVWSSVAGKRLTEKQIMQLFSGEEVRVRGLTSRKGTKFSATLYLEGTVKFKDFG
ncbi:DNA topoisomerase III [Sulfodiicoccus acidiphilus]|uniref:DNA topoisomerase n=1 Tax=Sulfodiicoccus acidiphilus TaxID=1670455 RepID=A0A348B3Z6_9CREN|nr:type IA DNA topoisomerase [Sulfodiicoccus acidiphilus]BBD72898.1 DNA topoisomerase III [Sulfodiicoccus acidiphilus]GGT88162.1 DNA topoisomerase III [Sulfodiicoccus acidiphilus]